MLAAISRLPLVPNGNYADNMICGRVFVQSDISGLAAGDNQFSQGRTSADGSPDLGMFVEYENGASDFGDPFESARGIVIEVELEDPLQIGKRILREDNHAMRRDLGRWGLPPFARASKYLKTSAAGIPAPDFLIFARRRTPSA